MGIFFFGRGERLLSLLLPRIILVSFVIDSKVGSKLRLLVAKGILNLLGRGKKRIDTYFINRFKLKLSNITQWHVKIIIQAVK